MQKMLWFARPLVLLSLLSLSLLTACCAHVARHLPQPPRRGVDSTPMVTVPAGEFVRGSKTGEGEKDESPERRVWLSGFEIDRHEVTVRQYARCVKVGACPRHHLHGDEGPGKSFATNIKCNWRRKGRETHPLNCVSWQQAHDYCAWVGKRLPSEAEWEKAARGTDGRRLPWLPKTAENGKLAANCKHVVMRRGQKDGCGRGRTWAVASRSPAGDSPYGVQDTVGNVAEWVTDWWHGDEPNIVAKADPKGPRSASRRVVRGGSFINTPSDLWTTTRIGLPPGYRLEDVGFRCAR